MNTLKIIKSSPANLLFSWFGITEFRAVANVFGICYNDSAHVCQAKVWTSLETKIMHVPII